MVPFVCCYILLDVSDLYKYSPMTSLVYKYEYKFFQSLFNMGKTRADAN